MKTLKSTLLCCVLLFSVSGFAQDIIEGANFDITLPDSDEPDDVTLTSAEEQQENKTLKVYTNNNDEVFITVDKSPRFPGGEEQMRRHIDRQMQYPEELTGVQGQVIVKFVVRKTGEITDVQVGRSVHPLLDAEAVRIVKTMPKWIPADYQGQFVSAPYELFIFFKAKK